MTNDALELELRKRIGSSPDIGGHLETLRKFASLGETAAELGTRWGDSTVALLAGLPAGGHLFSVDMSSVPDFAPLAHGAGKAWTFHRGDSRAAPVPCVDLLFIDTLHTYEQVRGELAAHGDKARRWLIFHDTVTFAFRGETGGRGIMPAILEFLGARPHWRFHAHAEHDNGLMILRRV